MIKRSVIVFLGMFLLVSLQSFPVQAVDQAYFTADKTTLLIGERVQLILHMRVPKDAQLVLPEFTNGLLPFIVENVGSLNVVQQFDDSSVEYELPLEVALWRTGLYTTPPVIVFYQLIEATPISLSVEALQFEVLSVLNENDLMLRPFKLVVTVSYFPVWEIASIVAVLVSVIVLLGSRHMAQLQQRTTRLDNSTITRHPEAVFALKTLQQIEELDASSLTTYVQVSNCLRRYLFDRYSIGALDLTTSELVEILNMNAVLTDELQHKLVELLKRADLVKFARVVPKQGATQLFASVAIQWIHAVEQANNAEQPS